MTRLPLFSQTEQPVVLLFAGDVVLSRHIESQVGDRFDYVFDKWNEVGPYDVFMVNLEHPVTQATTKVPKEFNFKMHPKYLRTLQLGGINIINAANNHVADYGLQGIYDTMRYLDSAGIRYVGIGKNLAEARKPVIFEKNGKKIGFLGYHGGGKFAAMGHQAGIAPRYGQYIAEDVARLRPEVDYVIVNFHWGTELEENPSNGQIQLAHQVIDAGADLIVGHHPHILQGIERYKGKVIAYSLGNFIFGGNFRSSYSTAVLKVALSTTGADVGLLPIQVSDWQPHLPSERVKAEVFDVIRKRSEFFSETISFSSGASE